MTLPRGTATGVLAGAATIAAVTVVARIAGLGRQLAFQHAVGPTDLGTAYQTANTVPNVLFEVVAGGALASAVVPVLAGALERGDRATASRTVSALLTWVVVILVPLSALVALAATPVMRALLDGQGSDPSTVVASGTRMLVVFLPQVALYGVAVVAGATLQAGRRFFWPAAAPLVSSLVVAAVYLLFAARVPDPAGPVGRGDELLLSAGTTLGVLALATCMLLPLRRSGLSLRPGLRFPDGVAVRARGLAGAGVVALVAQQLSVVVVLRLANGSGSQGPAVTYANTWMVFLLPYAVLAVPLATSAYPRLAASAEAGELDRFDATCSRTSRAVLAACAVGAAALAAAAAPVSRAFAELAPGGPGADQMARALVAFAPGLLGYGMLLHLSRSLYALGLARAAASATAGAWLGVVVADVVLVRLAPDAGWVVAALGLGNSLGMLVGAAALALLLRRARSPRVAAGTARTACGGLAGALAGGALGAVLARILDGPGLLAATAGAGLAAAVAGGVTLGGLLVVDRQAAGELLRLRGRGRGR